jgi:hypothetical protein
MEESFLDTLHVSNESKKGPFFLILYGKPCVGKSGMCINAPDPFYVSLESGTDWIPAPKFVDKTGEPIHAKTIDEVFQMLSWLLKASNRAKLEKPVKTVVLDSAGFMQKMIYDDVVLKHPFTEGKTPKKVESIIDLGFDGMGYPMDYWQRLLVAIAMFKKQGISFILITHSHYINVVSQDGKSYKEIGFELQNYGSYNVQDLLTRACDFCYYLSMTIQTVQIGSGKWAKNAAIGNSTGKTMVTTRSTPLFFAKTRAINENEIPDNYYYGLEDREEVQKQIFNDILNA